MQDSTVRYSTAQNSTVQHSTVQYNTVQYSTVQHSTAKYSIVHLGEHRLPALKAHQKVKDNPRWHTPVLGTMKGLPTASVLWLDVAAASRLRSSAERSCPQQLYVVHRMALRASTSSPGTGTRNLKVSLKASKATVRTTEARLH